MATSRELGDILDSMQVLESIMVSIDTHSVDADIQKWLSNQIASDRKLGKLDSDTKALVEYTIGKNADGM